MSRYLKFVFPVLLVLGVLAIFWQTHLFGLINLDDFIYVDKYSPIGKGLSVDNIVWAFSKEAAKRAPFPLTNISYMADYSFFGGDIGALHLENVALHMVTVLLVYALILKLLSPLVDARRSGVLLFSAFVGAAFWGMHPLRVEVVAWVASRKDLISTPLYLLGLLLSLRSLDTATEKWSRRAIPVVFILAILAKPTAVSFPLMVVAVEWLYAGRVRIKEVLRLLPISVAGCFLAYWGQNSTNAFDDLQDVTFAQRFVNAVASIGAYTWQTAYPSSMGVPYCFVWPVSRVYLAVGIVIIVAVCAVLSRSIAVMVSSFPKKERLSYGLERLGAVTPFSTRLLQTSLLWIFVTLLPMLGLVGFGYHSRADRFTFIPAVGLSLLIAYTLYRLMTLIKFRGLRTFVVLGIIPVLLALGSAAFKQTSYWLNDYTLFKHAVAVTDSNWQAHALIGGYLLATQGDLSEAVEEYRKSIALSDTLETRALLALVGFIKSDVGIVEEQLQLAREKQKDEGYLALYLYCLGLKSILDNQFTIGEARMLDAQRMNVKSGLISFPLGVSAEKQNEVEKARLFYSMASRSPLFRWMEQKYFMPQAEMDALVHKLYGIDQEKQAPHTLPGWGQ